MLNSGMVNGPTSCFKRATFCVFFPLLGRFLYFKNPVKYARNFNINLGTAHSAQSVALSNFKTQRHFNGLHSH